MIGSGGAVAAALFDHSRDTVAMADYVFYLIDGESVRSISTASLLHNVAIQDQFVAIHSIPVLDHGMPPPTARQSASGLQRKKDFVNVKLGSLLLFLSHASWRHS